ncbi:SRPBCC family protein [Pelagibacterium limicola]|uniref:SRPBCC family protein n=1 Tax=Pelagibacterium limicola TaxID=2791022 RepID=UPI0018AFA463|nr:SRPBCC domain-containing protein [Pelagibacterium limicola]
MADEAEKSITLTRTIEAPVEEVFAAWTDPALLEQWQAEHVEFEAFEGGIFRFETTNEDNPSERHIVNGRVLAIEQDHKLVETWQFGDAETDESTLIISFRPLDEERTEITLVEVAESHADAESRIFSIDAWSAALDELAELLE